MQQLKLRLRQLLFLRIKLCRVWGRWINTFFFHLILWDVWEQQGVMESRVLSDVVVVLRLVFRGERTMKPPLRGLCILSWSVEMPQISLHVVLILNKLSLHRKPGQQEHTHVKTHAHTHTRWNTSRHRKTWCVSLYGLPLTNVHSLQALPHQRALSLRRGKQRMMHDFNVLFLLLLCLRLLVSLCRK